MGAVAGRLAHAGHWLNRLLFRWRMTLRLIIAAVSFCVAFLAAWGLNSLALGSWRRSRGQHWTERARRLWPARRVTRLNLWLITLNLTAATVVLAPDVHFAFAAVPALLGTILGGYPMSRELFPDLRFTAWLHRVAASLLLFFGFWTVLLLGVINMPSHFGPLTWIVAGGILVLLIAFLFGLGVRLLCWLRLLKPAPESLKALVGEMSQKMGVPVRTTWVLSLHLGNAVALPLTRQLIFTDKLLATLRDNEIKAICAHELAHLNEPVVVRLVRALVALSLFPLVFARPLIALGDDGIRGFLALLAVVFVLLFIGIQVARRMEKRADKIAIESEFVDPAAYARALERLYQTAQMPAVMPRRASKIHPDLYDRMKAAGVTPDFLKPKPPSGLGWRGCLGLACLFAFPVIALTIKITMALEPWLPRPWPPP